MPITLQSFVERFRKSFQLIRDNVEILTTLDAHTGDGDHGVTMVRIVDKAEKAIETKGFGDFAALFKAMGMGAMSAGGGSAGPLMGQFFMGLANGIPADTQAVGTPEIAKLIEAGYLGMFKFSKAEVGARASEWYVLGDKNGVKAVGIQKRKLPELTRLDAPTDQSVFMTNDF
ncbi:MAG: DAK2 domain-containing protein, partial [Thermoguttaceae bacterium]|nr:DAK2 domain-containing protein [Thermoguttaceae bacterium]